MKCAWASIDENKKTHGGKAGNQGAELKTGPYYDFGQKYIVRAKDANIAHEIADAAYLMVINNCIGYDQYQRETLYVVAQAANWNAADIKTLCECDCSELAVVAINCAVKKALIKADTYSGNIIERCVDSALFKKMAIKKNTTIKQGDIIVNPGHHVIIAIGTLETKPAASKPANVPAYAVGKTYTLRENMYVRKGPGKDFDAVRTGDLTADGKKHSLSNNPHAAAILKKGTRVTCKQVINKGSYVWIRIPSGYVCAWNGEKRYVY